MTEPSGNTTTLYLVHPLSCSIRMSHLEAFILVLYKRRSNARRSVEVRALCSFSLQSGFIYLSSLNVEPDISSQRALLLWWQDFVKYLTLGQLVETLHHQPESSGFDFRWYHWEFFFDMIVPATLQPWGQLSLARIFLWTSCVDCHGIW